MKVYVGRIICNLLFNRYFLVVKECVVCNYIRIDINDRV